MINPVIFPHLITPYEASELHCRKLRDGNFNNKQNVFHVFRGRTIGLCLDIMKPFLSCYLVRDELYKLIIRLTPGETKDKRNRLYINVMLFNSWQRTSHCTSGYCLAWFSLCFFSHLFTGLFCCHNTGFSYLDT